jgi:hypothetical protein
MIRAAPLPDDALLQRYARDGGHTDCYVTDIDGAFTQADYILAFYTTWLFKLERLILKWAIRRPSTDDEAAELARGTRDRFAAWTVEDRRDDQLLMRDVLGNTRSWLMVIPLGARTRLHFGSAVVARVDAATGARSMGFVFRALLGFHTLYSIALLRAARSRLLSRR